LETVSVTNTSQDTATTHFRCDGIFHDHFDKYLLLYTAVKKFVDLQISEKVLTQKFLNHSA